MGLAIVMFLAGCFATLCTIGFMRLLLTDERDNGAISERRETLR